MRVVLNVENHILFCVITTYRFSIKSPERLRTVKWALSVRSCLLYIDFLSLFIPISHSFLFLRSTWIFIYACSCVISLGYSSSSVIGINECVTLISNVNKPLAYSRDQPSLRQGLLQTPFPRSPVLFRPVAWDESQGCPCRDLLDPTSCVLLGGWCLHMHLPILLAGTAFHFDPRSGVGSLKTVRTLLGGQRWQAQTEKKGMQAPSH